MQIKGTQQKKEKREKREEKKKIKTKSKAPCAQEIPILALGYNIDQCLQQWRGNLINERLSKSKKKEMKKEKNYYANALSRMNVGVYAMRKYHVKNENKKKK